MTRTLSITLGLFLAMSICAFGQLIDDPPLWTGVSTGTANQFSFQNFLCSASCASVGTTDVNNLGTTNEAALYVQGGPAITGLNPLDLIVGFVNPGAGFTAPDITSVTTYNAAGNPSLTGIINAGSPDSTNTGLNIAPSQTDANWTGSPNSVVYTDLGLAGNTGGSESFGNWSAAESTVLGTTTTNFYLALYNLTSFGASLTNQGLVDVTFGSTLAKGAIVVGYACSPGPTFCDSPHNPYSNPFTQSGLTTGGGGGGTGGQVPEPGSILLLGSGLVITFAKLRKKFVRS